MSGDGVDEEDGGGDDGYEDDEVWRDALSAEEAAKVRY